MKEEVIVGSIRGSAREIVRQAGLLQNRYEAIGSPSLCHALVELDAQGEMNIAKLAVVLSLDHSTTCRLVEQMVKESMCQMRPSEKDRRNKLISLTRKGLKCVQHIHDEAKTQVLGALDLMGEDEKKRVVEGLSIYAKALRLSNLQREYSIRPLQAKDVPQLIQFTRAIWTEFGFDADHPDAPLFEAELQNTYATYSAKKSAYFVLMHEGKIVGGAGFTPLAGEPTICELKGMYLSPAIRGLGLGKTLLHHTIQAMQRHKFKECYLETMDFMNQANLLYQKSGFIKLKRPKGNTGHSWTNSWYLRKL